MPAEWETHACTCLSWPRQASLVYPEHYDRVCSGYASIIYAIAQCEPVLVLVQPDELRCWQEQWGRRHTPYPIHPLPIAHDDAWLRDNGPTFVRDEQEQLFGLCWQFNAWGGKYTAYALDALVAPTLLQQLHVASSSVPLVMEGGSFHVDGEGTLLTTKQCLLNPNRNPHHTVDHIERVLTEHLGIQKIIWLDEGWIGDETDGHIDNVACFASPGRILLQVCDDPDDPQYAISQQHRQMLAQQSDAQGRLLELILIPQPPARFDDHHRRLTLSYLNFSFVNGGIVLPLFGGNASETDEEALRIFQRTFPERTILTVDGMAIIQEGGNVHCITQQIPRTKNLIPSLLREPLPLQ